MKTLARTLPLVTLLALVASGCQTTPPASPEQRVEQAAADYQTCRVLRAKGTPLPANLKDCSPVLDLFEQAVISGGVAPVKAARLAARLEKNTTRALRQNGLR